MKKLNTKKTNNNRAATKNNQYLMAKRASILSLVVFVLGGLFIIASNLSQEKVNNNFDINFHKYENEGDKNIFNNVQSNPYRVLFYLDQYEKKQDKQLLEKVIETAQTNYYKNLGRILLVEHLVNDNEHRKANRILNAINDVNFLGMKYYYKGILHYFQKNYQDAREYYLLSIEFANNDFVENLVSIALKALPKNKQPVISINNE